MKTRWEEVADDLRKELEVLNEQRDFLLSTQDPSEQQSPEASEPGRQGGDGVADIDRQIADKTEQLNIATAMVAREMALVTGQDRSGEVESTRYETGATWGAASGGHIHAVGGPPPGPPDPPSPDKHAASIGNVQLEPGLLRAQDNAEQARAALHLSFADESLKPDDGEVPWLIEPPDPNTGIFVARQATIFDGLALQALVSVPEQTPQPIDPRVLFRSECTFNEVQKLPLQEWNLPSPIYSSISDTLDVGLHLIAGLLLAQQYSALSGRNPDGPDRPEPRPPIPTPPGDGIGPGESPAQREAAENPTPQQTRRAALEENISKLQDRFDERHADTPQAQREALQSKLDEQFNALREHLEKKEARELQRDGLEW